MTIDTRKKKTTTTTTNLVEPFVESSSLTWSNVSLDLKGSHAMHSDLALIAVQEIRLKGRDTSRQMQAAATGPCDKSLREYYLQTKSLRHGACSVHTQ